MDKLKNNNRLAILCINVQRNNLKNKLIKLIVKLDILRLSINKIKK